MHKHIIISLLGLFVLWSCEQTPNSLEVITNLGDNTNNLDSLTIVEFDYSYLSGKFFVSAYVPKDDSITMIWYYLERMENNNWIEQKFAFTRDNGSSYDRIPGDSYFDHEFIVESFNIDSIPNWRVRLVAGEYEVSAETLLETPLPPTILNVIAPDTLWLYSSGYLIDTLQVQVSHSKGLDEIRSVTFRSKKPGTTTYTQAFDLYDDGGQTTLFNINDTLLLTSNDIKVGDGIWSFPIALNPTGNTGTNYWLFQAQSWNGQVSTYEDSLVIMAPDAVTAPRNGAQR